MSLRLALAGMLAALLASCSGSSTPASAGYPAAIQEGQDAAYEVLRQGDATSLGIALVTRDRVVWAESFGLADIAVVSPPGARTMFGIGSVSKMFAAVAVMQLVERGMVDLDAPLVRYLPGFRMAIPGSDAITVRMLLDHASGIPGTTFRNGFTTAAVPGYAGQVVTALQDERLKAPPGHMSVYCNDGFTLVEALVEAVTGESYAGYVRAHVLEPLGMGHSSFPLGPFPEGSYAKVYRTGVVQPQEYTNLLASGGLYTTPTDMAAFARAFLNGGVPILAESSVREMAVDQTPGTFNPAPSRTMAYGLGWDSVVAPGLQEVGVEGWTKNGGSFFYGAQLLVAPLEGLAVVVMGTNGDGYDPLAIAQRVLLRALAETGRIPYFPGPLPPLASPEASAPDGLVASIAGVYAAHDRILELRPEPDGTVALLAFDGSGFAPTAHGLRYREDAWFTSRELPLVSYRVVEGGGTRYLVTRRPMGDRSYLDQLLVGQSVRGPGALSAAWSGRVGRHWLVANESPDSQLFLLGGSPLFSVTATPELPGLVIAVPSLLPGPQVLDPSTGDSVARMMLVIPGGASRDLNDLDVEVREGEEWVRWGNYLNRPLETVPVLPPGSTTGVPTGPEGYGEWRAVSVGALPVTVTVSGARAWRAFGSDLEPLANGGAQGDVTVPPGTGILYLLLYGTPGGSIGVGVETDS